MGQNMAKAKLLIFQVGWFWQLLLAIVSGNFCLSKASSAVLAGLERRARLAPVCSSSGNSAGARQRCKRFRPLFLDYAVATNSGTFSWHSFGTARTSR
jgi:hypothetical protein